MYLNKALIFGNLTRDPELKSLPSGTNVATFAIATNRTFKDKEGNNKEETQFHNIVVFGRQAENVSQYLGKGSTALIEGRIQNRSWETPNGEKRFRSEIVADRVQFGPRKGGGAGGGSRSQNQGDDVNQDTTGGEDTTNPPKEDEINPDDIPF